MCPYRSLKTFSTARGTCLAEPHLPPPPFLAAHKQLSEKAKGSFLKNILSNATGNASVKAEAAHKWLGMVHIKIEANAKKLAKAMPPPAPRPPPANQAPVPVGPERGVGALAAGLLAPAASNLSCARRELRQVAAAAPLGAATTATGLSVRCGGVAQEKGGGGQRFLNVVQMTPKRCLLCRNV
eukprot:365005-Chlamydomonas_euryale.AAC.5